MAENARHKLLEVYQQKIAFWEELYVTGQGELKLEAKIRIQEYRERSSAIKAGLTISTSFSGDLLSNPDALDRLTFGLNIIRDGILNTFSQREPFIAYFNSLLKSRCLFSVVLNTNEPWPTDIMEEFYHLIRKNKVILAKDSNVEALKFVLEACVAPGAGMMGGLYVAFHLIRLGIWFHPALIFLGPVAGIAYVGRRWFWKKLIMTTQYYKGNEKFIEIMFAPFSPDV